MAEEPTQEYTLGKHIRIEGELFLVVRYCDSSTLFEETTTNTVLIEKETYVELRNKAGEARFIQLSSTKSPGSRDAGPIKGVKPYFWKVA